MQRHKHIIVSHGRGRYKTRLPPASPCPPLMLLPGRLDRGGEGWRKLHDDGVRLQIDRPVHRAGLLGVVAHLYWRVRRAAILLQLVCMQMPWHIPTCGAFPHWPAPASLRREARAARFVATACTLLRPNALVATAYYVGCSITRRKALTAARHRLVMCCRMSCSPVFLMAIGLSCGGRRREARARARTLAMNL